MLETALRKANAVLVWALLALSIHPQAAFAVHDVARAESAHAWWFWPVILFVFCFVLSVIAVLAGVGGGVLFVPLVSGFFPFHIDFVRGATRMSTDRLLSRLQTASANFAPPLCPGIGSRRAGA